MVFILSDLFLRPIPFAPSLSCQAQQYAAHQPLAPAFSGAVANGILAPPEGAPIVAAPVPVRRRGLHIPSIPKFEIPEQWARPECLPPTPPSSPYREEEEVPSEENSQNVREEHVVEEEGAIGKGGAVVRDAGVAIESGTDLLREGGGGSSDDAAEAKRGEDAAGAAEAPAEKEDPMDVIEDTGNAEDHDRGEGAQEMKPSTSASAAQARISQEASTALPQSSPGSERVDSDDGAAEEMEVGQPKQQQPSKPNGAAASSPGADAGKRKGKGRGKKVVDAMEEVEEVEEDEEDKDMEEGFEGPVRATRAKAEREKLLAQKEAEEVAAKAEREADEKAAEEAKAAAKVKADADAAAKLEAARKEAADAREAERADRAAETAARRVRVNLMLRRLREDVEERQRLGQSYGPNDPRYYLGSNAGALDADGDGEDPVVAVPSLADRSGRDKGCNGSSTDAEGGGKRRKTDGEKDGGNADSGVATADAAVVTTTSTKGSAGEWPPLGQRRLNRRLDRVRRFSALSQGPGPHQRLSLLQEPEKPPQSSSGKVGGGRSSKAAGIKGGWLDTKLARMRRCEEGEWNAWKRRLKEEEGDKPREVAGPPLPFGFVPRLAHRALGAYALIRTFSRPFRIAPCTSIAFLRAMTLQLRNPLLDAVHCELLRRISCSLRGRIGGWWKGRDAQKELDWRYLDLVSVISECCFLVCVLLLFCSTTLDSHLVKSDAVEFQVRYRLFHRSLVLIPSASSCVY